MKLLARFRCCKASIGSLFWYELMANCSVWEVRGLPISQRMTVMSTTGKVKQHFDFDLECPVSRVGFWPIEIRHIWSWFLHENYCNAYKWKWNHSTILSQTKIIIIKETFWPWKKTKKEYWISHKKSANKEKSRSRWLHWWILLNI